jgi:hypothetical protein
MLGDLRTYDDEEAMLAAEETSVRHIHKVQYY